MNEETIDFAIHQLEAIRAFCHKEAIAEHNADDARTAFAIVRGECGDKIKQLQQRKRDAFWEQVE